MKNILIKELYEQTGIILLGIFMAFAIVTSFWIHDPGTAATVDVEGHKTLETIFLLLFVVYAAAFSNAIAGDRDRGDRLFLASLPIPAIKVWLMKLCGACMAIAVVHICVGLIGVVFGYPQLMVFAFPGDLPPQVIFILLLSAGASLMCAALFHRSFSVLMSAIVLTFMFAFISASILFFWRWETMMGWTLLVGLTGMICLSAWAFSQELRGSRHYTVTVWSLSFLIIVLMVSTLLTEYNLTIYRTPALSSAEVVIPLPDLNSFLVQKKVTEPIYQLDSKGDTVKRVAMRFETAGPRDVSPSGNYILLHSRRGFWGSFKRDDFLFRTGKYSVLEPARTLSEWIGQEKPDHYEVREFGSPDYILDLKTGSRAVIPDSEFGSPWHSTWYDHTDILAVNYYKSEKQPMNSIILLNPDGSVIKPLVEPQKDYVFLSTDSSTIGRYSALKVGEPNDTPVNISYKTWNSQDWITIDHPETMPIVSPDHQWMIRFERVEQPYALRIIAHGPDNELIPLGDTTDWVLHSWSPSNSYLVFARVSDEIKRELVLLDIPHRTIRSLTDLDPFFQDLATWEARLLFSPDEQWLACCGHRDNAAVVIQSIQNVHIHHCYPDSYPIGWIDSQRFLIRNKESLVATDVNTWDLKPFPGIVP